MRNPTIHGKRRTLSASRILDAIAADLAQIKAEDDLTFSDMARVFGRCPDQAEKYTKGTAEMGAVAYTFARREWNGRFTGTLDALLVEDRQQTCDRSKVTLLLEAVTELQRAIEDDDEACVNDVRKMRRKLEGARDVIAELLNKLSETPSVRAA